MRSVSRAPLFACSLLLLALPAGAQQLRTFLDTDDDPVTGCSVVTVDGPFNGVELILRTTLDGTFQNVVAVDRLDCVDPLTDTFGTPVAVDAPFAPPWPVGLGLGTAGSDVVETYLPLSALPATGTVRVGFEVDDGVAADALLTDDGSQAGAPMLLVLGGVAPLAIPTLQEWVLLLLALLLAISALWTLRRHRSATVSLLMVGLALGSAAVLFAIVLDGNPADWTVGPLGNDPADPDPDLVACFGVVEASEIFFRCDVLFGTGGGNTSPVADPQSVTADLDTPLVLTLTGSDGDGDALTFSILTPPTNGTLGGLTQVPPASATVTYTPDPGYLGGDSFLFQVDDGNGGTDSATVSITVADVDTPPTAVNDAATVTEDDPATAVDVLINDTDPDGGPISIAAVTQPAGGTVVITGGGSGLTYQPAPDLCNDGTPTDDFTYTLSPGGSTATVSMTVTCVDDPPTAVDDAAPVAEDAGATPIPVLANDSDVDGGQILIASVTQPPNGTVVITGGGTGLTYEPDAMFCNDGTPTDDFTYTLTPGGSTATVRITIPCDDDPPTAVDDMVTVTEDDPPTTIDVLLNDTDPDLGPIMISSVTQPANGTVLITNGGADLTYQPDPNYCNDGVPTDDFTYTLTPGGSTATVAVTVTCVDDPPTAVDDTATVTEDDPATAVDVLINDTDPDGGAISITGVTQPANGTVVISGGGTGLTYQPNLNYCNDGTPTDNFTYTLTPGGSVGTVAVTVVCVNDPPMVVASPVETFQTASNTALQYAASFSASPAAVFQTGNLLTNFTDIDGPSLTASLVSATPGASVTVNPDGTFLYTPPAGLTTSDTFQYQVTDTTTPLTRTVTVNFAERVWYVQNDAAAGGLGRSSDPFDTLAEAETASAANDVIFVFAGDGTTTGQDQGVTLKNGQKLLGHRASTLTVGAVTIQTPGNGNRPRIEHTAGDGARVLANAGNGDRSGIEIRGLEIAGDDNAIDVSTADANNVDVAFSDNLLSSTNGASLVVDGSGSTGTAAVRELDGTNVATAGAGGGLIFESVTFDADVVTAGIQPVAAGNVVVGNPGSPGDVVGHGVRLNSVRGILDFGTLDVGNSGGVGLFVRDADGKAGTFVLDTDGGTINTVNGPAIDLDPVGLGLGGMDGMVLTSVTANVTAGVVPHGINLHTVAGSFQVTGATSISASGGGTITTGIAATNATASITFTGATTVTNTTGAGIALSNVDGPFTVASASSSVTGASGAAIDLDQGLGDFTYNGSIANTAGRSVEITNHEGPGGGSTVSLTGSITDSGLGIFLDNNDQGAGGSVVNLTGALNLTTGASNAFTATNGGTINVTDPANNNLAATTTGTGVNIANTGIGASGVKFTTVNVGDANPAAPNAASGILLDSVPSGDFTATGGAIQNVTSRGLDVQGGSGDVTVGASISTTTTGRSLEVTGKMGGAVAMSGAIDDNGLGVNLDNAAGTTINITGSLDIDTVGANTGFNATNAGTLNVFTGTNTIDTSAGTGIGVNITNTTIGGSGVTFRSVSTNGATSGIVLNTTGAGGFEVTGDGASNPADTTRGRTTSASGGGSLTLGSGGTIQNSTGPQVVLNNASNVVLRNLVIQTTAGAVNGGRDGIDLSNGSSNVTLDNLLVTGHAGNHGIDGSGVSNVTIQHCEVHTNATAVGTEGPDVHNVRFDNLSGTSSVANSLFHTSRENIFSVFNTAGTLNITVTNSEIRDTTAGAPGNVGLLFDLLTTATVNADVVGSSFLRNRASGVQFLSNSGSTNGSLDVMTSTFEDNFVGIDLAHQSAGQTVTFDIRDNLLNQNATTAESNAVNIVLGGLSTATTVMSGTLDGNTIGNGAITDSGSFVGAGFLTHAQGAGTMTVMVTDNTVRGIRQDNAFATLNNDGSALLNLTFSDNDFSVLPTGSFPLGGLDIQAGAVGTDTGTTCVNFPIVAPSVVSNIAFEGSALGVGGVQAQILGGTPTIDLQGYGGAANNMAAITAFLNGTATTVNPAPFVFPNAGTIRAAPAPCPTP